MDALNTRFCFLPYFENILSYARSLSWISVSELSYILTKFALRCLIGFNIGEGNGAAIGFTLGWGMISTLVLAVGLAFAVGYAFTIIPMLQTMSPR